MKRRLRNVPADVDKDIPLAHIAVVPMITCSRAKTRPRRTDERTEAAWAQIVLPCASVLDKLVASMAVSARCAILAGPNRFDKVLAALAPVSRRTILLTAMDLADAAFVETWPTERRW